MDVVLHYDGRTLQTLADLKTEACYTPDATPGDVRCLLANVHDEVLKDRRLTPHFTFIGDFSRHYGIFAGCGTTIPYATTAGANAAGACC
jgi:hypothetical protein